MKKLVFAAVIFLSFSAMAVAQDTPAVEIFGGYSFATADTEIDYLGTGVQSFDLYMNGWNASVAINGNNWLGFVADVSGLYGTAKDDNQREADIDVNIHSLLFGPRVTFRQGKKYAPFIQSLFGYSRLAMDQEGSRIAEENDFAMAIGGGIDVNLNDRISIRPAQLEYFGIKTGLSGDFANQFRYSAGVLFKMGKR